MVRLLTIMLVDIEPLEEYLDHGTFYDYGVDDSKPLEEQVEEEIVVLETECDIQEANRSDASGIIKAYFNVFFPVEKGGKVNVKRGMKFKGDMSGLEVNGEVVSVAPSKLCGCVCTVKDLDV